MERIKIELKDKSEVTLSFSNFFLGQCERMLGIGFQDLIGKLIGKVDGETVAGGMLDSVDTRAIVLAAGMTASSFETKELKEYSRVDGYEVMEKIPDSLSNKVWVDIYGKIVKAIVPEAIEDAENDSAKKKTAEKHTASGNSQPSA